MTVPQAVHNDLSCCFKAENTAEDGEGIYKWAPLVRLPSIF